MQPDVLHEGVPPWLVGSLIDWLRRQCYVELVGWGAELNPDRVRELERRLHLSLGQATPDLLLDDLLEQLAADGTLLLRGVNVALGWYGVGLDNLSAEVERELAELENALQQAGSAWKIGYSATRGWGLERRVDETVAEAARAEMSVGRRPSEHLAEAWRHLYGRQPSPGPAYDEAVKAVEAAAIPIVCPEDKSATLGKIIGLVRSEPDRWALALQPHDGEGVSRLRAMLELLWKSQRRHGTPDRMAPRSASPEEAEAAVLLAMTLVHWLTTGAMRPT
ncbi:MAG: hypothetical protein ACRDZ1_15695 [Acidimicrobiia bacterium]